MIATASYQLLLTEKCETLCKAIKFICIYFYDMCRSYINMSWI